MKTALTFLFALSMSICQAQWTDIINEPNNDSVDLNEARICTIFTPTAFTPDSDGLNDNFKVVPSCPVKDYYLKIYNRTGKLVFESNIVADVWNGSEGDSYYLESSLFTYQLTYAWGEGNGLSEIENKTGTVLVVR